MECLLNIQSIALPGLVLLHPVVYTLPPFSFPFFFFPLRGKKKNCSLPWTGESQPFDSLISPLSNLLEILDHGRRSLQLRTSSFVIELVLPRRVITRDGGSSNLTREVSLPLFTCTLPEQGEYFQVDSNSRGIQTK